MYFLKQGALLHQCGVGIANRGQCCLDESAPESVRRNALQESDVVLPGGKLSSLDYTTFLKLLSVNGLVWSRYDRFGIPGNARIDGIEF